MLISLRCQRCLKCDSADILRDIICRKTLRDVHFVVCIVLMRYVSSRMRLKVRNITNSRSQVNISKKEQYIAISSTMNIVRLKRKWFIYIIMSCMNINWARWLHATRTVKIEKNTLRQKLSAFFPVYKCYINETVTKKIDRRMLPRNIVLSWILR